MSRFLSRAALAFLFGFSVTTSAQTGNAWSSSPLGKSTLINSYASEIQSVQCDEGKYIVGMEVRSGTLVDGMGIECATLGPNGEHKEVVKDPFWLGSRLGGNVAITRCPAGQVMTAARGRAGEFVDQVAFACRSWNASNGLHGALNWRPAHGGQGGQPVGPVECPANMAMTGVVGIRSASYVGYFHVVCKSLPPTQPPQSSPGASGGSSGGSSSAGGSSGGSSTTTPLIPGSTRLSTGIQTRQISPTLKALSSKALSGGNVELTIEGENFSAGEITRVEVGGTAVSYRVVSPTRVVATVPQHVWTKLDKQKVPIVVTSGRTKISQQLAVR